MDKNPLLRWLIAAAALPLCAAVIFLLLWLNPHKIYAYRAQTASADEAVKTCPFALITQEEFELAEVLRASKDVASFFPNPGEVDPPPRELPVSLANAGTLQIGGQVTSLSVQGLQIILDYATPAPDVQSPRSRCTLSIAYDGTVVKTSAQYENGVALYIVDNTDNAAFIVGRNVRDLLYFLHDN